MKTRLSMIVAAAGARVSTPGAAALLAVFCCLTGRATGRAEGTHGPVEHYVSAVSRIKSFDVTMRVCGLSFPDLNKPEKPNSPAMVSTNTVRDVFARGLGRRVERYGGRAGGELNQISVIEWDVAAGSGNLARALHCGLSGRDYLGYLNPTEGRFFLTDLLRDRSSTITPLDASLSPAELTGFEVKHPALNGATRFWLDSRHGWMLKQVEVYIVGERSGAKRLSTFIQVDEFIQVEGDVWAPSKGSLNFIVHAGPAVGRAHYGCTIALDAGRSFWNTIKSKELFVAASLPAFNHEEQGWKQYYPEAILQAIKRADKIRTGN